MSDTRGGGARYQKSSTFNSAGSPSIWPVCASIRANRLHRIAASPSTKLWSARSNVATGILQHRPCVSICNRSRVTFSTKPSPRRDTVRNLDRRRSPGRRSSRSVDALDHRPPRALPACSRRRKASPLVMSCRSQAGTGQTCGKLPPGGRSIAGDERLLNLYEEGSPGPGPLFFSRDRLILAGIEDDPGRATLADVQILAIGLDRDDPILLTEHVA